MRKGPIVALALAVLVTALYWSPIPPLNGVRIGGYPWNAPEGSRVVFMGIGAAVTGALFAASFLALYFSKKIEELEVEGEEEAEVSEEYEF